MLVFRVRFGIEVVAYGIEDLLDRLLMGNREKKSQLAGICYITLKERPKRVDCYRRNFVNPKIQGRTFLSQKNFFHDEQIS